MLRANGAEQPLSDLSGPGGRRGSGWTLEQVIRDAVKRGSPATCGEAQALLREIDRLRDELRAEAVASQDFRPSEEDA